MSVIGITYRAAPFLLGAAPVVLGAADDLPIGPTLTVAGLMGVLGWVGKTAYDNLNKRLARLDDGIAAANKTDADHEGRLKVLEDRTSHSRR